ncbi:MAG: hypothetical protein GC165_00205 [Armatimonadetes bacterium]|nr:hypothetical protein [Armatimonadota bacterium]
MKSLAMLFDDEDARQEGTTVPYSREVPTDRKKPLTYNLAASRQVRFGETETAPSLFEHPNKLGAAIAADFFELKLMASVQEAAKAQADVDRHVMEHNERAIQENKQIEAELERLLEVEQELFDAHLAATRVAGEDLDYLLPENASTLAKVGLVLDPNNFAPVTPAVEVLSKPEAHAARLKLPFCPQEKTVFWTPATEVLAMALVAMAQGLGIGSIAGMVSLSNAFKNPVQAIFCALLGVSIALCVGGTIKAAWRGASEAKYLGEPWKASAVWASIITAFLGAIEVAVDCCGLMAYRTSQAQVDSVGLHSSSSNQPNLYLFLLCGAVVSVPYAFYCAFAGWRKERIAAANKIILAQEEERHEKLAELHGLESWPEALASCNAITAWKVLEAQRMGTYEDNLRLLESRRQKLKSQLRSFRTSGTEEEILVVEKARTEVSGLWGEYYQLLAALQQNRSVTPTISGRSLLGKRPSLWDRFTALFVKNRGVRQ